MVASAMCTQRAGAGSAEARSKWCADRGSEVRIGGPEQGVRRFGGSEIHCHFIAPAPSLSTKRCPHSAAVDPDITPFLRSEAHTKDRKKGCAYDPGVLSNRVRLETRLYGISGTQ